MYAKESQLIDWPHEVYVSLWLHLIPKLSQLALSFPSKNDWEFLHSVLFSLAETMVFEVLAGHRKFKYEAASNHEELCWRKPERRGRRGKWHSIKISEIDQFIGVSLMGWVTENGKDVWGIVNECGAIVAHGGTAQFTYVLNRVFLQFLVKKFGKPIMQ